MRSPKIFVVVKALSIWIFKYFQFCADAVTVPLFFHTKFCTNTSWSRLYIQTVQKVRQTSYPL